MKKICQMLQITQTDYEMIRFETCCRYVENISGSDRQLRQNCLKSKLFRKWWFTLYKSIDRNIDRIVEINEYKRIHTELKYYPNTMLMKQIRKGK